MSIDHKAKAEELLHFETETSDALLGRDAAQVAQVHATLALADQQRIANLMAYVALLESQFRESVDHPEEFDASTKSSAFGRHKVAVRLIREGLGL